MSENKTPKKIGFGSDHGAIDLKNSLKEYVASKGIEIVDYGTNSTDSVDYPVYGAKVAEGILSGEVECGIICCGSGIGISISANKFPGIRAALCHDHYGAKMSRLHNNANVLAMGGRTTGIEIAKEMVDVWLETEFEGGRHENRINKFDEQVTTAWKQYLANNS